MDSMQEGSGNIGFIGALGLLFIALKLLGYVSWSWVWVLLPLWLGPVVFGIVFILALWATGRD